MNDYRLRVAILDALKAEGIEDADVHFTTLPPSRILGRTHAKRQVTVTWGTR